ncbi:MAG: cytochrome C biogenesis protein [Helicobacter sp.]|uniref:cytochrome c biogenesis CcdA family protein n=1 Tax=Helicobacter sp. TaxID=218 RepID=UPI0025C723C3|nr:cytochrome c biogenesis protein CcdA [Helicobacter sp.]MCH5313782.1 cytochrome C biogenesis protein [Helicobacter sp.]
MIFDHTLIALYESMPFGASFCAGILTFLSPCIAPLIPPYISYISGVEIQNLEQKQGFYKWRIIYTALLFIVGFSLVFIIFALFASSILGAFFAHSLVRYIAGGIIILFGIHFLFPLKLAFLYKNLQLNLNHTRFGFLSPFILGIGFSIGWSPCIGPILASILTLSLSQPTHAFWLMLCYCGGLGISFLLVAIFVQKALGLLKKLTPFLRLVEVISGLLLMLIGVLIITHKTDFLLF